MRNRFMDVNKTQQRPKHRSLGTANTGSQLENDPLIINPSKTSWKESTSAISKDHVPIVHIIIIYLICQKTGCHQKAEPVQGCFP